MLNFKNNRELLYRMVTFLVLQWESVNGALHLTYVYAKFYMSDLEFKPISVQCMFVLTNANSAQNVSPKSKHPFLQMRHNWIILST